MASDWLLEADRHFKDCRLLHMALYINTARPSYKLATFHPQFAFLRSIPLHRSVAMQRGRPQGTHSSATGLIR